MFKEDNFAKLRMEGFNLKDDENGAPLEGNSGAHFVRKRENMASPVNHTHTTASEHEMSLLHDDAAGSAVRRNDCSFRYNRTFATRH